MENLVIVEDLLELWPEYKSVSGPYKRSDGWVYVYLYSSPKKNKQVSYSKAIVESFLQRKLKNSEGVVHLDGNLDNFDIQNLKVVSKKDQCLFYISKGSKRVRKRSPDVIKPCCYCGKEFVLSKDQKYSRSNNGPFCSISCANRFRYKK
jgi:hypothetical protein